MSRPRPGGRFTGDERSSACDAFGELLEVVVTVASSDGRLTLSAELLGQTAGSDESR